MSEDLGIEAADDVAPPDDGKLRRIADLTASLRDKERLVIERTAALREALAEYRQIEETDLPRAMLDAGCRKFVTDAGTPVEVVDRYNGTKIVADEALDWVEANGGAGTIRTAVVVEFDRNDLATARAVFDRLKTDPAANSFRSLKLDRYVPPPTAASFAKELTEAGKDPPLEMLGVRRAIYAKVGKRRPKSVALTGLEERD